MKFGDFEVGLDRPFFLIAGPCVIESEELCLTVAAGLAAISQRLGLGLIFKSSFLKDNRSSELSYQGPGPDEGLRILEKVRADRIAQEYVALASPDRN